MQRSAKERRIEELRLKRQREAAGPQAHASALEAPISLMTLDSLCEAKEMLEVASRRPPASAAQEAVEASLLASLVVEAASALQDGKPAAPPDGSVSPAPAGSTSLQVPSTASSLSGVLQPVGRMLYSPQAMVDLMAARPDYSHAMLCAHFGRPPSWLATVLASEAFQKALEGRRDEIADPSLTASLHERYKALAIRTSNVMMTKLDSPEATDFMVLKAGEIAFKALGMGQKQAQADAPAPAPAPQQESLAERLMKMMDEREGKRTVDVDVEDITPDGNV